MIRTRAGALAMATGMALVACGQTAEAPNAPADAGASAPASHGQGDIDETATLARIANGAYRFSPQFIPINREPYESIAASGTRVNVWVSTGDAPSYERISPEKSGSRVNLTPGAVIVREVIQQGVTVKLTVIVKGPSGYNPDVGDLWFAVTEANGAPIDVNGAPLMGRLSQCTTCHSLRWEDGFLFGVPFAQRSQSPSPDGDAGIADASSDAAIPPVSTPPVGTPPRDVCGDFVCSVGESCVTCPSDCGPCGDDHGGGGGGGSSGGGGPGPG